MGAMSPFHWLIVLALFALIAGAVAIAVTLSGRSRRPPEPPVAAGWFIDPQDPNLVRWFDGRQWTVHTQQIS